MKICRGWIITLESYCKFLKIYRIYMYLRSRIKNFEITRLKILSRNRNTLWPLSLERKRKEERKKVCTTCCKIEERKKKKKRNIARINGPVPSVHVFHRWWQAWNLGRVAIPMVITGQERIINTASRVISSNLSAKPGLETPLSLVQNLIFA